MADAVAVAVMPARIGAAVTGAFGVSPWRSPRSASTASCRSASSNARARLAFAAPSARAAATSCGCSCAITRRCWRRAGVGLAMGALGASVLRTFLTGVGPTDPIALLAAVVVVAGSALAATTLPARRATRVDPMVALRDP